jgi:hypothetical protein
MVQPTEDRVREVAPLIPYSVGVVGVMGYALPNSV